MNIPFEYNSKTDDELNNVIQFIVRELLLLLHPLLQFIFIRVEACTG
jgi:hypothetical protein